MGIVFAETEIIRYPVAAGVFYPEDMDETQDNIQAFCPEKAAANAKAKGHAHAIIVPHGAWNISGFLAGAAFTAAAGRSGNVNRVVVMGPIHDRREEGIFLSSSHFFQTSLGLLEVDQEISERLEEAGRFLQIDDIPHLGEHSIEVLLPFIKYFFPDAAIVPVLMGQPNAETIEDLANALRTVFLPILDDTLFVVSCNLSIANDNSLAQLMAEETLRLLYEKNGHKLVYALQEGKANPCGGALAASLLKSGLLDNCHPYFVTEKMASAVEEEGYTVFFGAVSFE